MAQNEPRGARVAPCEGATPGIYGNAAVQWRTTACHDGNLKCSVIRGIVRLSTTKPTIMTEQDKITIFDAIINPFLCHTPSPGAQGSGYLFPEALRRMLNASLSAQCDNHIGCAKHERSVNRNGMRNGYKPRTILTSTGEITLDVPRFETRQLPSIRLSPVLSREPELTALSISPSRKCTSKAFQRAKSPKS